MSDLPEAFVHPRHGDTAPPAWLWPDAPREPQAMERLNWLDGCATHAAGVAVVGVEPEAVHEVGHVCRVSQVEAALFEASLAEDALVVIAGEPPEPQLPVLRGLAARDRVLFWRTTSMRLDPPGAAHVSNADQLLAELDRRRPRPLTLEPRAEALRLRRYRLGEEHWLVLFNSGDDPIDSVAHLSLPGRRTGIDPQTARAFSLGETVRLLLPAKALALLRIEPA